MGRRVRKRVYIDPVQEQFLKARAKGLGVTEAELIRSAIDILARLPAPPRFDPEAWQAVLDSMDERGRLPTTGEDRTWRREDLHEERPASHPSGNRLDG